MVLALEIGFQFAGMRPALATAALIKKDDAIARWVEQPAHLRIQRSAGPAVQEDCRLARRIPALLPVDLLAVAYIEHPAGVRLDRWVQRVGSSVLGHCVVRGV